MVSDVRRRLGNDPLQERKLVQGLLCEGLNGVFFKRGMEGSGDDNPAKRQTAIKTHRNFVMRATTKDHTFASAPVPLVSALMEIP